MNNGAVTPASLVQLVRIRRTAVACGVVTMLCTMASWVWWKPGQGGSSELCVQETQSALMGTLSIDELFRHGGPVGSYGREAGFLLHYSILASPIPGTPDLQSLRWRLISGSLCVCSFYAPHDGIATHASSFGARQLPQSIVSRSSTQATSSLLAGRLQHLVSLYPGWSVTTGGCTAFAHCEGDVSCFGVPEPSQSPNPSMWCRDIILSTLTLPCHVTVDSCSDCCRLAPLFPLACIRPHVVFLSSGHSPGLPVSQLSSPSLSHLPRARGWSTVVASCDHSLSERHQSVLAHGAHSLTFLHAPPLKTPSSAPSPKSSLTVHSSTHDVGPLCPTHAGGNPSGGMMLA